VIFLAAAMSGRLRTAAWAVLAVAATANVIAAIPPSTVPGSLVPLGGLVGIVGSVALVGVAAGVVLNLRPPQARGAI
jgi:hypothetical protein